MTTYLRRKVIKFARSFWKVRPDRPRSYLSTEAVTFRNAVAPTLLWIAVGILTLISVFGTLACAPYAVTLALATLYLQRRYLRLNWDMTDAVSRCVSYHESIFDFQSQIEDFASAKELRALPEVKVMLKRSRQAEKETLKVLRMLIRNDAVRDSSSKSTLVGLKEGLDTFEKVRDELALLLAENSKAFKHNPKASPLAASALSSIDAFKEASKGMLEQRQYTDRARAELAQELTKDEFKPLDDTRLRVSNSSPSERERILAGQARARNQARDRKEHSYLYAEEAY